MTPHPILARSIVTGVMAAIPDHARANLAADDSSVRLTAEDHIVDRIMVALKTCEHGCSGTSG